MSTWGQGELGRWLHTAIAGGLFLILVAIAVIIDNSLLHAAQEAERRQVTEATSAYRASLEDRLYQDLHSLAGLKALVMSRIPNQLELGERELNAFASILASNRPEIRSLQLAPEGVVSWVYPVQGNREAIGHRLLEDPRTREAAQRAIDHQVLVVAGPYPLIQGGVGLVARLPIFIDGEDGKSRFWGFAVELIDFPKLMELTAIRHNDLPIRIALRGQDARGETGEVFFGNRTVFTQRPIVLEIPLPEGAWEIAAIPYEGWRHSWSGRPLFVVILSLAILLITLLSWSNLEKSSRLRESERSFRRLATVDGLTGLANRREFDNALVREWRRCARGRLPISLVMIDIDHFKAYNDSHGHLAGDDALKAVAREIARVGQRPMDLVARYGGEEFAILLPETDLNGAMILAERARHGVERLHTDVESQLLHPQTISAGVASRVPEPNSPPTPLVEEADTHLYRAKAEGRNRVCPSAGMAGPDADGACNTA